MEEKKNINSNYGILVILMFAIICTLSDYIIIDRKLREDKSDNSVIVGKSCVNESIVDIRTDSTKDYVYDASYDFNFIKDSYSANGKLINKSDIVVPYININSDAAKKVNDELIKLYTELGEAYNDATEKEIFYRVSKYDYYTVDNILSVVVTVTAGGTDVPIEYYHVYNFNLNDGSLMSYNDVYSFVGFDLDGINDSIKNSITNIMQEKLKGTKDPAKETGAGAYYPEGTNFDTYNNESYDNYVASVNDGTIKYFIDSNKKLNVIVTLSIPAGRGEFDTIITVD